MTWRTLCRSQLVSATSWSRVLYIERRSHLRFLHSCNLPEAQKFTVGIVGLMTTPSHRLDLRAHMACKPVIRSRAFLKEGYVSAVFVAGSDESAILDHVADGFRAEVVVPARTGRR